MSQENVERVHEAVSAFNRRDIDAFLGLVDPDVHFTPHVVVVEGGYRGHDGIRRWWQDLFDIFPDWSVEPEVRDLGDVTLAKLRVRGHGGESGTPVDQVLWQVAEWNEHSKIVRLTNYGEEAEALAAVGLRE
jgi:ketosteroid isomerase-like protein